jgi:hypothetical protein
MRRIYPFAPLLWPLIVIGSFIGFRSGLSIFATQVLFWVGTALVLLIYFIPRKCGHGLVGFGRLWWAHVIIPRECPHCGAEVW